MIQKEQRAFVGEGFFIENLVADERFDDTLSDFKDVLDGMGGFPCPLETADLVYSFRLADKVIKADLSSAGISNESGKICFYADSLSALNHLLYTYMKEIFHKGWVTPIECVDVVSGGGVFLSNDGSPEEYRLPFVVASQFWGDSEKWHRRMRRISDKSISVQHMWRKFIPPDKYFDENPNFFAQIDGERKPYQLCTSNRDVIKIYIDKAVEYFGKYPYFDAVSLSPDDNYNFCQCDRCRSLDEVDGCITDRLMVFFNKVAQGVVKKCPGKKLAFYAYLNYTDPPVKVKPHKALIPVICHTPWEFCHNHSVTDENCVNNRFRQIVEGWVKLSDEVYIREYYGHFHWYGIWPILHTIKDDIDFYRSVGVKGVISESHEHWGCAGWVLYGAGCYLAGDNRDWKRIVSEYCEAVYPNGSEYAEELIFMLEEKTAQVSCRRMDLVFDDETMCRTDKLVKKISRAARTKNEKMYAEILKQGVFVTKMLININREIHKGNIDEVFLGIRRFLDWIEKSEKNKDSLPVIKYRLAKSVFLNKYKRFCEAKEEFRSFCELEFNIKIGKLKKVYPIKKWMVSDPFILASVKADKIKMYPDDGFSECLDTNYDPKSWHGVVYADDFFSLYQYFQFRPDCIKYYRKVFSLKKDLSGFLFVRAVDGYKLFLNGTEIFRSNDSRFDKKSLFDYIKIDIPAGENEIVLKLESSSRLSLDDFSVILFNADCESVKIDSRREQSN